METLERLVQAVQDGETEEAMALAQEAMATKIEPLAVMDALTEGIREVGDRFERMEVFLPEMMLAAQAMQKAMGILSPYLERQEERGEENQHQPPAEAPQVIPVPEVPQLMTEDHGQFVLR